MKPLTPKPILTTIIKKRISTMRKITKHFILGSETKTDASKVVILPPTKQDLIGAQPASQTLQTPTGDQQI